MLCLAVQLLIPLGVSAAPAVGGGLTIASLVRVARYLTGQVTLTPDEMVRYDLDGNGAINIGDMVRMAAEIIGGAVPDPPAGAITDQEAMQRALELVPGAQLSDIREIKRDVTNGRLVYDIEIVYGGFEYESEMDAQTGEFLSWGFEQIVVAPGTGDIGIEAARQIALDRVPGATTENIVELKSDFSDGVRVYDCTIAHGGRVYECEIHASTGQFIQWGYTVVGPATEPTVVPMPTTAPTQAPTGSPVTPDPTPLTEQQARQLVLSYVPGATGTNIVEFERDFENGHLVYEGEIHLNGVRYEFALDAYTGERLEWHQKSRPSPGPSGVDIGADRARELALAQVPGATQADIYSCERGYYDGIPAYEVKLRYGGFKYEFEIVASTGQFGASGFESLTWVPGPRPTVTPTATAAPTQAPPAPTGEPTGLISRDRAIAIALERVPGATMSNVRHVELDHEHGRPYYEVELRVGRIEYEITIDARTGAIVEFDQDYDD